MWAAGNGGDSDDSCAADGYSSSIYTISIGSADQNAGEPFYDEQCASKMAVTFTFNSVTFPSSTDFDPYDQIVSSLTVEQSFILVKIIMVLGWYDIYIFCRLPQHSMESVVMTSLEPVHLLLWFLLS